MRRALEVKIPMGMPADSCLEIPTNIDPGKAAVMVQVIVFLPSTRQT